MGDVDEGEKEASRQRKRAKLLDEIIDTERTYVSNLRAISQVFLQPLRERVRDPQPLCSTEKIDAIFSNIDQIIVINEALLGAFEATHEGSSEDNDNMGQVIHKYANFLKTYTPFINNYEKMLETLDKQQKNSEFAKFLEEANMNPLCHGLPLPALLITPVQRIPRYKLLFGELLKLTPKEDPEYEDIQTGLGTIDHVAAKVNAAVREKERRDKLLSIQDKFIDNRPLCQPNRWFVKEGPLKKMCRKGPKEFWFILFNDSLLYAETLPGNRLRFHRLIDLSDCKFQDVAVEMLGNAQNNSVESQFAFQIHSNQKSFLVFAPDLETKYDWLAELSGLKRQANENLMSRGSGKVEDESAEFAPIWIPDKESSSCSICSVKWSWIKRRHHCRMCGGVVCGDCSNMNYKLAGKQVRLCLRCIQSNLGDARRVSSAPVDEQMLEVIGIGAAPCFDVKVWATGYQQARVDGARYDYAGYTQFMDKYREDVQSNPSSEMLHTGSFQAGYVQGGYDAYMEESGYVPPMPPPHQQQQIQQQQQQQQKAQESLSVPLAPPPRRASQMRMSQESETNTSDRSSHTDSITSYSGHPLPQPPSTPPPEHAKIQNAQEHQRTVRDSTSSISSEGLNRPQLPRVPPPMRPKSKPLPPPPQAVPVEHFNPAESSSSEDEEEDTSDGRSRQGSVKKEPAVQVVVKPISMPDGPPALPTRRVSARGKHVEIPGTPPPTVPPKPAASEPKSHAGTEAASGGDTGPPPTPVVEPAKESAAPPDPSDVSPIPMPKDEGTSDHPTPKSPPTNRASAKVSPTAPSQPTPNPIGAVRLRPVTMQHSNSIGDHPTAPSSPAPTPPPATTTTPQPTTATTPAPPTTVTTSAPAPTPTPTPAPAPAPAGGEEKSAEAPKPKGGVRDKARFFEQQMQNKS